MGVKTCPNIHHLAEGGVAGGLEDLTIPVCVCLCVCVCDLNTCLCQFELTQLGEEKLSMQHCPKKDCHNTILIAWWVLYICIKINISLLSACLE